MNTARTTARFEHSVIEKLRPLVSVDADLGSLVWLPRPRSAFQCDGSYRSWNTRYSGLRAFNSNRGNGYLSGFFLGKKYLAHRVLWALVHGDWPDGLIDHINGVRDDNRISNLRLVDAVGNQRNRHLGRNNTSGHCGVSLLKGKWRAQVRVNGRMVYLGSFESIDLAIAARNAANAKLGFHIHHGTRS